MSDLLLPSQKPMCLKGCVHCVIIDGLNGNRHPRCLVVQMPIIMQGNQLIIDVAKCPVYMSEEDAKKLANQNTTQQNA